MDTQNSMTQQLKPETLLETIEYRVARSKEELEKAYFLVYKEYLKKGYVKESEAQLKYSLYNAMPDTTTFVTVLENEIFATATLIPDSPLGLPMDDIYNKELNQFRQERKKICEISMLASDTGLFQDGVSMMLNSKKMFFIFYLFKTLFDYAIEYMHLDCICITINPKHNLTYDFLLFKTIGELKTYDNANGAPAIAKYLDLNTVEAECKNSNKEGLYRMFFQRKTPADKFANKFKLRPEDLIHFFVKKSTIFQETPDTQLNYIKRCYPSYDFSVMTP